MFEFVEAEQIQRSGCVSGPILQTADEWDKVTWVPKGEEAAEHELINVELNRDLFRYSWAETNLFLIHISQRHVVHTRLSENEFQRKMKIEKSGSNGG